MPRRFSIGFGLCVAAVTLAACTLFTDLSSLEALPPDAGSAGSDASSADTAVTPDSAGSDSGDSGVPVDAGDCDATFCDDFDDVSTIGQGWDTSVVQMGTLAFDTTDVVSPPQALRARLDVDGGVNTRQAQLRRDLGPGSKVTCTFAFRLVSGVTNSSRDVDLLRIEAADPSALAYRFNLAVRGPSLETAAFSASLRDDFTHLDGGCICPASHQFFAPPKADDWVRASFVVDYANGGSTVTFDGVIAFSGGTYTKLAPTRTTVILGLSSRTATAPDVLFDDLKCSVD